MTRILIETSARHIHLCQEDLDKLFGPKYSLGVLRSLSQPGEFAAKETLIIKNGDKILTNIRIIGPVRPQTQVELSKTDAYFLGLNPPVRRSGDLNGSEKCTLIGPKGEIQLLRGVILAWRHIHVNPRFVQKNNLNKKEFVSIKIESGNRSLVFHQVYLQIAERFLPAMHIDTDEANAAGLNGSAEGEIIV